MTRQRHGILSSVKWPVTILILSAVPSTLIFHRYTIDNLQTQELGTSTSSRFFRNNTLNNTLNASGYTHQPSVSTTANNITFTLKQSSSNNNKNKRDPSLSPVCYPFATLVASRKNNNHVQQRTVRRIYFAHMRKAGGTTLRSYLATVAQHFGLDFVASEGGHLEVPGTDPHTLYVTHLRDPYRRAISHFQYEVRWPCEQLLQNESFVPTLENAANLTAWIAEPYYQHPSLMVQHNTTKRQRRCDNTQAYLIDCASNCYVRWMNYPSGACSQRVFQRHSVYYHKALQYLRNYDIVIDTDRLFGDNHNDKNNNTYAASLQDFFGVPGINDKNRPMYCLRVSRNANRQYPLQVDNSTRQLFEERNQADYDLYHELVDCPKQQQQQHAIQFPRSFGSSTGTLTLTDLAAVSSTTAGKRKTP